MAAEHHPVSVIERVFDLGSDEQEDGEEVLLTLSSSRRTYLCEDRTVVCCRCGADGQRLLPLRC
jgi:hypothetical protein